MEIIQPTLWDQPEQEWQPYKQANVFARGLGFEYVEEWLSYVKDHLLPEGIPGNPEIIYRFFGWKGWRHWLVDPTAVKNTLRLSRRAILPDALG
jgi:hypothetical protein